MATYHDPLIDCSEIEVRIRRYYPWGAKRIPYPSISSLQRFELTTMRGKYRIWGSGTLKYWANLDTGRPRKNVGFYIDNGRRVRPLVTPDDPDAFERAVNDHIRQ